MLLVDVDANVEIAGRHLVGCGDQVADRRHQSVGEIQSEPDGRQQHDRRQEGVHQHEGPLHGGAIGVEGVITADQALRLFGKLHRDRVDGPGDVKECVLKGVERAQRDEALAVIDNKAQRLPAPRVVELGLRRSDNDGGGVLRHVDAVENFAVGFHQRRDGEAQEIRPRLEYLVKIGTVGIVKDARAIEVRSRELRLLQ